MIDSLTILTHSYLHLIEQEKQLTNERMSLIQQSYHMYTHKDESVSEMITDEFECIETQNFEYYFYFDESNRLIYAKTLKK